MTNEIETALTAEEAEALIAKMDLFLDRQLETAQAVKASRNAFEAYWAGSASASVERDYRAGRVITIRAGR